MNLAGRAMLVRFVLTAIPMYVLVALKVPKWFIRAIDEIRRGFLWKGRKDVKGGCYLVAWEKVVRPIDEIQIERGLVWKYLCTQTPPQCLLFQL
jgi:hypothetical protein